MIDVFNQTTEWIKSPCLWGIRQQETNSHIHQYVNESFKRGVFRSCFRRVEVFWLAAEEDEDLVEDEEEEEEEDDEEEEEEVESCAESPFFVPTYLSDVTDEPENNRSFSENRLRLCEDPRAFKYEPHPLTIFPWACVSSR